MPLPWKQWSKPVKRIRGYENRAITIRQLNDLSIYLQRLCKAGLLRFTSEWSKRKGVELHGKPVAWSLLNMYIISEEVLTKVIRHYDPHCPDQTWYSWVEFLNGGEPKRPKVFFSHWWGGHFRDFMQVAEHVRKDRYLSIHDGIWVCTFALNQFGDDLGSSLDSCPFVSGLLSCEHVVLVVDRQSGSLTRTWCAFELWQSAEKNKTLDLFAPTGKVGSEGTSSVALLDAVEAWDIRDTNTTNPADRRQIFNRIAGVDELDGLLRDAEGRPVIQAGRKALQDERLDRETLDRELRLRTQGEDQKPKFERINSHVRGKVRDSLWTANECHGCKIDDHALRGIPLGQLKQFFRKAMSDWRSEWESPSLTVKRMATYVNDVLLPNINGEKCSYVERWVTQPVPPMVYLAYASDQRFAELVKCVEWQAEAREFDDNTAFFLDIICLNPALLTKDESIEAHRIASAESQGILVTHGCDRAWVLCDLAYFLREDKFVDLGCPTGVLACTRPFRDNGFEYGQFCKSELTKIMELRCADVNRGSCSEEDFEETVKKRIVECFPNAQGQPEQAFRLFEESLKQFACGPLLRRATFQGKGDKMRKWCASPGMLITNKSFRGGMGEMPVHIAAGAGNLESLRTCLDLKADPNAEDVMRERPLHYAALAGSAPAVQVLLRANADPTVRSAFLETPLDVARENAAAYLGVETAKILELLQSAEALEWQLAQVLTPEESERPKTMDVNTRPSQANDLWLGIQDTLQKFGTDGKIAASTLTEVLSRILKEDASLLVQSAQQGEAPGEVQQLKAQSTTLLIVTMAFLRSLVPI
ncbi:unnamed protein product [Durusdinium trenchii]|uniref:Uncharacterized protein n=1 Tax=Durusdinium trenchii TaxID=1381693 RepID=A0ABP0S1G9_9DINO